MFYRASFVLSFVFHYVATAKIGIFTAALSNSQIVFNIRIAESLVADGHDVVLIRPEYNPQSTSLRTNNPKIKEIHVAAVPHNVFKSFYDLEHRAIFENFGFWEFIELSNSYRQVIVEGCKAMLNNNDFIQKIRNEKIDLAFHHHIDFCQHGIAHHVGIKKWVSMMPGPAHSLILQDLGIPYFDAYMPNLLHNITTDMTFIDRVKTVSMNIMFNIIGPIQIDNPTTTLLREKFGQDFIHISNLRKNAILTFVNNDPLLEYPYPHTQKIQFIGGIGTQETQPLQEPVLSIAKQAKRIVLVSFGSVATASEMPDSWKKAIIQLFEANPDIQFFWKFEEQIKVPKNVYRSKWLPQNDLLALNRTVAFITHGGYNSLGEAVQSGTPCVFVPLIADQFRNSKLAEYRGIGIQQSKFEFTFEQLNVKLHEILTNPIYLTNVRKYQSLTKGRLNTPDLVLQHWTNLALIHELDMSLPNLTRIQLYNIDVYLFFLIILIAFLLIIRTIFRWYYWSCCEMAYKEKEKIQ